ncbi:MAG TPA: hypothetical protein VMH37_08145 [Candidatus Binataceae bacterium]|nr:hypothetical protein [Candidatus Binataceae bacterium]
MPVPVRPTIIVPGIEGSALQNAYPISPTATWSTWAAASSSFIAPDFDALALSDDALTDRGQDVLTRPNALLSIAYAKMVSGLQSRTGVPAYVFPYDWRYSNRISAGLLVSFVDKLLLKKIDIPNGWDRKFDFVCHSMGGLILRSFLEQWMSAHGSQPPVGRVVFIATPHLGSLNAAKGLIVGDGVLPGAQKDMRKLARTFPSVYELLPLPRNGVMWAERASVEVDLFQESNWQQNVTPTPEADPNGYDVQQQHLDAAAAFLNSLPQPSDPKYGITNDRMLVIYGQKEKSALETVPVGPAPENWYDFAGAALADGDDVVLVGSARLTGVASVAIRPQDIGWDLLGRIYGAIELHPFLPAIDEVQTITSRFLQGYPATQLLPVNLARLAPSLYSP